MCVGMLIQQWLVKLFTQWPALTAVLFHPQRQATNWSYHALSSHSEWSLLASHKSKKKQGVWICRDWYIYTITIKDQIAVVNMQGTQLACCSDSTCPIWHTQHFLFSLGMSLWWPVSILVHVAQPNIAESWELLQSSVHSAMPCHVPSVWLELKPGMALSLRWRYPFLPFQNRCKAWTHMVKF